MSKNLNVYNGQLKPHDVDARDMQQVVQASTEHIVKGTTCKAAYAARAARRLPVREGGGSSKAWDQP